MFINSLQNHLVDCAIESKAEVVVSGSLKHSVPPLVTATGSNHHDLKRVEVKIGDIDIAAG